ncbi:MAG: ABC transporter permease [Vulcanimicrobiaceae bacterium]
MTKFLAFVERDFRLTLSYPVALWMPFASIAVTVAGFAYMSRLINPHVNLGAGARHVDYFSYVVINLAFMLLQTSALRAFSDTLRRDQLAGTLEAIFATRTNPTLIAFASGIWPMLVAAAQTIFYFIVAWTFGLRLHEIDVEAVALFLILGAACMALLGVIGAAIVLRFRQAPPSTFLVGSASALLTGVLFPVALLPAPLRVVSWLLPMTHSLSGLRAAMLGTNFSAVRPDALWLVAAIVILLPAAVFAFVRSLEQAKTEGTLASY